MVFFFKKQDKELQSIKTRFKSFIKLGKKKEWKKVCEIIPQLVTDIEVLESKTQDENSKREIIKLKQIILLFKTNLETFERIQNGEIHFMTPSIPEPKLEPISEPKLEPNPETKSEEK